MAFKYTKDQEKVIYTSGSNILVSAAAGSGKTAVLVQRIIRKVIEDKVSIDKLLIVTFTSAAAAEMRERIGNGIEKAINDNDEEDTRNHLIKQMTLLPVANIMTMHSFCLKLLKSYYHLIGLDPTFCIGNETELVLLKEEVMDDLLEAEYEKAEEPFLQAVESFADGKDDQKLRELIFNIYRFSMSNPWPEEWLDNSLKLLQFNSEDEFMASIYYQVLIHSFTEKVSGLEERFEEIYDLMTLTEGPDKYRDTVEALERLYKNIKEAIAKEEYLEAVEAYKNKNIPPLSRKTKGYNKELASEAKEHIDYIRKALEHIELIKYTPESLLEEKEVIVKLVGELVRLTKNFSKGFSNAKKDKNLIDFNDFEHFALDLLYEDGKPSEIAAIFKEQFVEILVDEYQDTNEVQEAILKSLSGPNNLFMVGDLKQSIYKFRLAKPEIFKEKYDAFEYENSENIKIDLAKNFRSRPEVLDFTNEIFEKVMSKDIGDVDYNEHARLYHGSFDYEEKEERYKTEIILSEKDEGLTKEELQGEILVSKIKALMADETFTVFDKEEGVFRKLRYEDICVLMRSPSTIVEELKTAFDNNGIPYFSDVSSGFFDAVEVSVIINLLKLIDNPYQDIPLASVLRSGIVGIGEEEMLDIKEFVEGGSFFECLLAYVEGNRLYEDGRHTKLSRFLNMLNELRSLSLRIPLDQLLDKIYIETGYPYYVRFMENGNQRVTNLEFLKEQARTFENSSYKGLFNFIRYIDHIKKHEIEIPEPLSGGEEKGVTFLSIHKSKGLEFPIVFVINLHKEFNKTDLRKSFIMHQDLGFGCDYFEPEIRFRKESYFAKAIKVKSERELISEEMRLFYVALTRAREKLFLVAVVKDLDKFDESQLGYQKYIKKVPYTEVAKVNSYLDLVKMSIPKETDLADYEQFDFVNSDETLKTIEEIIDEERQGKLDLFKKATEHEQVDKSLKVMVEPYPYMEQTLKYMSMSVSELKEFNKKEVFNGDEYSKIHADEEQRVTIKEKPVPTFVAGEEKVLQGATYGLVMHKILSLLPPKEIYTFDEVNDFVNDLFDKEIIEQEYRGKVYIKPIYSFTKTNIFNRMYKAGKRNRLYREQPFVLGIEDHEDLRMIQGVIDLYFEEEDGLVLLDYKTDYVGEEGESLLVKRYKIQLDYYKQALESITGKRVKESYIYSLSLGNIVKM